jgi:hypothetical protein
MTWANALHSIAPDIFAFLAALANQAALKARGGVASDTYQDSTWCDFYK